MTTKVTLRERSIKDDKSSLYLDIYPSILNPETGKDTRRQYLKMHIFDKPKDRAEKLHNKQTRQLAKSIRAKRENELNKPEIYSRIEKEQLRKEKLGETNLVLYFNDLVNKRVGSNKNNWKASLAFLKKFLVGEKKLNITFAQLDVKLCDEFNTYLLSTTSIKSDKSKLSQNSAYSYFNKFKVVLKQAYKEDLLSTDLNAKIKSIKEAETSRSYLTLEELNMLVKAKCRYADIKRAALFSALTGMRFSDIKKLVWEEIEHINNQGYFVNFKQQKTKGIEVLPISDQAFQVLGKIGNKKDTVFNDLKNAAFHSRYLKEWITEAGITKNITFHNFRHTFATLQLVNNTDIYTVSKMLGHRNLKTTQIYAKVVDQAKRDAADKIKLDFN